LKLSRRVAQVWNWLPAFRAVAEVEHLPTASKEVNLSPSALSRSVRLLEDDLGVELFAREGRYLELTTAGRRLLAATRAALFTVESALDQILSSESSGAVHISAPGPYCSLFVLPGFRRLREQYPGLVAHLSSVPPSKMVPELVDGSLDIAIGNVAEALPELRVTKLGELTYSVYAGASHPLTSKLEVTLEDVLHYPFVGPPEHVIDHFPPHLVRSLAMVVEQLQVAIQVCAVDGLLAVLPDVVAADYRGDGALVRLPIDLISPQPLYAISRHASEEPKRIDLVVKAIAQTVEDVNRGAWRSTRPPPRSTIRPPAFIDAATLAPPRTPLDLAGEGGPARSSD
jgi:DNA-binding transcriptional LysR family regulator